MNTRRKEEESVLSEMSDKRNDLAENNDLIGNYWVIIVIFRLKTEMTVLFEKSLDFVLGIGTHLHGGQELGCAAHLTAGSNSKSTIENIASIVGI